MSAPANASIPAQPDLFLSPEEGFPSHGPEFSYDEILEKARETRSEAHEMMDAYLGEDADGLDGLEFLTMAEAGEVGHWNVVNALNQTAGDRDLQELIDLALPMQEAHFQLTLKGSIALAKEQDPGEPA